MREIKISEELAFNLLEQKLNTMDEYNANPEAIYSMLRDERFTVLDDITQEIKSSLEEYLISPFDKNYSLDNLLEDVVLNYDEPIKEGLLNYEMEHDPYKNSEMEI